MSNSGVYRPWNSPSQNTGVGSLSLFQGIFPTQRSKPGLLTGQEKSVRINESLGVWCKHMLLFETGQPKLILPCLNCHDLSYCHQVKPNGSQMCCLSHCSLDQRLVKVPKGTRLRLSRSEVALEQFHWISANSAQKPSHTVSHISSLPSTVPSPKGFEVSHPCFRLSWVPYSPCAFSLEPLSQLQLNIL